VTYSEAIDYLYQLRSFGMKLGLDKVRRLMDQLGAPDRNLRFIHVAGTNGKGSVCAFLDQGLRFLGHRVGMFTSPHLIHFGERIRVQGKNISDSDVIRWTQLIRDTVEAPGFEDELPTFFEAVTVMAALHFREQACDWVVWETGLGGRLDSTNIVDSECSAITHIDLDHQEWLGNSLELIAAEKAGIIKPGRPCFLSNTQPTAVPVVRERCEALQSPFNLIDVEPFRSALKSANVTMNLKGEHQIQNAALAWNVLLTLLGSDSDLNPVELAGVLAKTEWAGRFQCLEGKEGRRFFLDGAHNPSGIEKLIETASDQIGSRPVCLIFTAFKDKSGLLMLERLMSSLPRMDAVGLVSSGESRSSDLRPWLKWLSESHPTLLIQTAKSFRAICADLLKPEMDYLVTGSLHFIGEALGWLMQAEVDQEGVAGIERASETSVDERGLNNYR
jgi:dihydrofolate synthase / folylpolyglutamate synthase